MKNKVKINETIGLIYNFKPDILESFQSQYPEFEEMLRPGIVLGNELELNKNKVIVQSMDCNG